MRPSAAKAGKPEKVYPGVFSIPLPLPGRKPGPVNAYLFTGRTVVLLDTGIKETFPALEAGLHAAGIDWPDLDTVILSHGHLDHMGAIREVKARSGARILAHAGDRRNIEKGTPTPAGDALRFYRRMGMPAIHRAAIQTMNTALQLISPRCLLDGEVADGDRLELGDYEAVAVSTPGHSPGSIGLYIENEGIFFSGDHLLSHITPNALTSLSPGEELPARRSQAEFYHSLGKVEKLGPRLIFPGHGEPVTDLNRVASMYRQEFERRRNSVLETLDGAEMTVFQIVEKLFPYLMDLSRSLDLMLAVSEVYTHLQLMEDEGLVGSRRHKSVLLFRVCPGKQGM